MEVTGGELKYISEGSPAYENFKSVAASLKGLGVLGASPLPPPPPTPCRLVYLPPAQVHKGLYETPGPPDHSFCKPLAITKWETSGQ